MMQSGSSQSISEFRVLWRPFVNPRLNADRLLRICHLALIPFSPHGDHMLKVWPVPDARAVAVRPYREVCAYEMEISVNWAEQENFMLSPERCT
eukprot:6200678-Pleurochrysis_carterae.AAC.1